jgi:hypothetical protein
MTGGARFVWQLREENSMRCRYGFGATCPGQKKGNEMPARKKNSKAKVSVRDLKASKNPKGGARNKFSALDRPSVKLK